MRLDRVLSGYALRRPQHPALVCGERRVSYGELDAQSRRVAAGLVALGVAPGARVLAFLPNGVEYVQLAYGTWNAAATLVPVNHRYTARELAHIAYDSTPAVIAYRADARETVRGATGGLPAVHLVAGGAAGDEIAFESLLDCAAAGVPVDPVDNDCMILYTSGTTGKPKGAINTHANLLFQSAYFQALEWGLSTEDRSLVTTPIAHRAGCARLVSALGIGATLVIMERFGAEEALATIERERITVAGLVPTMLRMMLPALRAKPAACASLRVVIVTTEAFPVPLKQELASLLPQAQLFSLLGSSEAFVTSLTHREQITHAASVGCPVPGVEVRLVDEADRDVPPGEVGEIVLRHGAPGSGAVMRGYFGDPQATAAAFRNGWFHTGDMARADADGYLYVVDRKKDMVLSGGYNIYSKEVEQVLMAHPAVAEAAVIGVPDPVYGEAVAAYVEPKPGATLDTAALLEHCRRELAGYKKPKYVEIVASLPRNAVGKVVKNTLRERFARETRAD